MMWRYYELLTDVRTEQIAQMKADAASGKAHPMALKKELARGIVADFHSAEAAEKAAEDWAKQFQQDGVPELETEEVRLAEVRLANVVPEGAGGGAVRLIGSPEALSNSPTDSFPYPLRVDKLLRHSGLAASNTEAAGKIKQGAVSIDGQDINPREVCVIARVGSVFVIRVGRRMKKVKLTN